MRSNLLDVGGTSVEYLALGEANSRDIVLLHEGLGCLELWRDFPQSLATATGNRVVAYSRTGYGNSDPIKLPRPLDHMEREALDFLPSFFQCLALEQPILLGHSDGATIALEFAAAFPEAVSAVILMAPHVFVEQVSLDAINAANDAYANGDLREKLKRYHGANVDSAFRGWCDTWLDPNFRTWDMRPRLSNIKVPILQLQGINDEYGTVLQIQSINVNSGGPVTSVMLPNCGHAPHLDKADETLAEIVKFIKSLDLD